jgi:competence protein ComFA
MARFLQNNGKLCRSKEVLMKIALYQVAGDEEWRMSLAPEVDERHWRERGRQITWLGATRSIGLATAFIRKRSLPHHMKTGLAPLPALTDRDWDEVKQTGQKWIPLLTGRALLLEEIEALLLKHGQTDASERLRRVLQWLILEEECDMRPGVVSARPAWHWRCERCGAGGDTLVARACASCQEHCVVCETCLIMGRSRTCTPFFLFTKTPGRASGAVSPLPEVQVGASRHSLTVAQRRAVTELREHLCGSARQVLVWAVTGAGKTEMMFPLLEEALRAGKKVAWVTPRKDVVLELAPRIRQAFNWVRVLALHGGSADAWLTGEVVVATAHQMWRFAQAFEWMVVDEVDAFPLYGHHALEQGLYRALAPSGKQVLLTATPPAGWQSLAKQGRLPCVVLPARHHGFPLPEPRLAVVWGLWRKLRRYRPIPVVEQFLRQVEARSGQAMLFVPRVQDVKVVVTWLIGQGWPQEEIAGVYAAQPDREEEVARFRDGSRKWLVTTTILERGVTVPRVHVLVLGADHPVFDRAGLVQMAGRVGRRADYQEGEVWFVAEERTEAQIKALKEIKQLNHWAAKEGFLQKEAYSH